MPLKTPEPQILDFTDKEFRFITKTTREEVLRVIECKNTLRQYGNHAIRHLMGELEALGPIPQPSSVDTLLGMARKRGLGERPEYLAVQKYEHHIQRLFEESLIQNTST